MAGNPPKQGGTLTTFPQVSGRKQARRVDHPVIDPGAPQVNAGKKHCSEYIAPY